MPRKTKKQQHDDLLASTLKRFDDSWQYAQQSWHSRWDRDWKLYNNKRVHASYEGISDTFVPMVFSTIETMVAALGNGRPRFDFEPVDPRQVGDTKALNSLIDDYWEGDRWDIKLIEAIRQMLITGTAPLYLYWDIDHPCVTHFSIRDAIVDPTATNPDDLTYAGRRYLTTVEDLKSYEVVDTDPESKTYGQMRPRFSNLDKMTGSVAASGDQETDKANKEMFTGSTMPNPATDQVEVIEIWDAERVVCIANRQWVIQDIENPFLTQDKMMRAKRYMPPVEDIEVDPEWQQKAQDAKDRAANEAVGMIPFVFFRNYTDVSLFYAKSEVEPIAPLQEYLNDFKNMNADAIIKQLAQQKELDPAYTDWLDLINDDPATVYPFVPGSLKAIDAPVIPANAFNEQMNTKNEIRETTAVDQVVKGVAGSGDQTATEVKAQMDQAGQRIAIKARLLEKDGFYYFGKLLFKMIQLYVDQPMAVRMDGLKGNQPQMYGALKLPKGVGVYHPSNYQDDWEPHVTLETSAESKKAQDQAAAAKAFQILIQDPSNNLDEIKRIFLPKMLDIDPDELQRIMTPSPEQQAQAAVMQGGAAGTAPLPAPAEQPMPAGPEGVPQDVAA